jgi:hypothetical protein
MRLILFVHRRADDEWSFVETLRHLAFAVDVWVSRIVLGEPMPYHRLGLPPTDYPTAGAAEPVGDCLRVVMRERCKHRRYAVRDLALLEAR